MVINPIVWGLYTHYKDSLLKVGGFPSPRTKELIDPGMLGCNAMIGVDSPSGVAVLRQVGELFGDTAQQNQQNTMTFWLKDLETPWNTMDLCHNWRSKAGRASRFDTEWEGISCQGSWELSDIFRSSKLGLGWCQWSGIPWRDLVPLKFLLGLCWRIQKPWHEICCMYCQTCATENQIFHRLFCAKGRNSYNLQSSLWRRAVVNCCESFPCLELASWLCLDAGSGWAKAPPRQPYSAGAVRGTQSVSIECKHTKCLVAT